MTAKEQIALSVLEYWHAIEFLGQDSYETCTDAHKLTQELSRYKKSSEQEKASRKQIMVYTSLDEKSDIHSLIVNEASTCGMRVWGNLTFYIGRVKRQGCIRNLAERLGHLNLQQAEESTDDIAMLSFQCDQKGVYVRHSLSLSTIVWALSQVSGRVDAQISEILSESAYRSTIDSLEIELFGAERSADEIVNEIPTEFLTETLSDEESPVFSEDAVTGSDIVKVQAKLVKTYGKFLSSPSGTDIEPAAAMKFQLFRDQKAKEKYDDDNYMGLSYDFFSHDLKMVKDCIKNDNGAFEQGMLRELVEYICAPHNKNTKWKRHDLVRPNDRDVFAGELLDILHIRNAPLGKWPSRYMPALMQQAAVNLALSNTDRSVIGQIGKVFSVNGPPGTGKTTMLKEIIAEHIVEKARLLSDYQRPDDTFKAHAFQHGDKNGAYSTYYPSWFSFLDGRIGDHGVLVLSCNNAAVENITKELPLSSGISDQLKVHKPLWYIF